MRSLILQSCAYLFLLSCVVGVTSGTQHEPSDIVGDGASTGSTSGEAHPDSPTVFNGIEVPPMKILAGEAFDAEIRDGYWYAKAVYPPTPLCC